MNGLKGAYFRFQIKFTELSHPLLNVYLFPKRHIRAREMISHFNPAIATEKDLKKLQNEMG